MSSLVAFPSAPDAALLSVLYISSTVADFTDEQLIRFLRSWRDHNRQHAITGFLLYAGGNFMQALEGPPTAVTALIEAIAQDSRHHGMIVLWQNAVPGREFASWSMGFRTASELSAEDQQTFSTLLETSRLDEPFRTHPGRAHQMLWQFKQVCVRS